MEITKEQLNFLQIFDHCKDKSGKLTDKIHIKLTGTVVRMTQLSGSLKTFKEIDVSGQDNLEDFECIYSTQKFIELVRSSNSIQISKNGISFGSRSKYNFESLDITYPDLIEFLNLKTSSPDETFLIKDLGMSYFCQDFTGSDRFDYVALQSNHFASSDHKSVACITPTSNTFTYEKDEDGDEITKIFIPSIIISLFEKYGLKEIEIHSYSSKGFWSFTLDGCLCIVPIQVCPLPNIVSGGLSRAYDHKDYIIINRKELSSVIKRMKVMDDDKNGRLRFTILEKELLIENSRSNKSSESIECTISDSSVISDTENSKTSIILSSEILQKIISTFTEEELYVYIPTDPSNFSTIRFEDKNHLVKIVHILFEEGS